MNQQSCNIIDVSDSQNTLDNPSINTDYSPNNNLTQQQYELTISYDMSSNSEEAEKNTSHTYIKMSQETLNFIKDKFNLILKIKYLFLFMKILKMIQVQLQLIIYMNII